MTANRVRRHLRGALFGVGLIVFLWALWTFIAFVPFNRETNGLLIAGVTLVLFFCVVFLLRKRGLVDWRTGLYAALFIGFLVVMYMVPIRGDLPPEAHRLNQQISAKYANRYEYARDLFYRVADRYTGPTREYLRTPHRVFFIKDAEYFWNAKGEYVPSHIQAQIYRQLLIESGRFHADEVEMRTGGCVNSPHGYLAIQHPEREIYADLWAVDHFDKYRFGQKVEMPGCGELEAQPSAQPYKG